MIHKVGVIGAGQMGGGIAHVFAQAGYEVRLSDVDQNALDKGLDVIRKNMERLVSRNKITSVEKDVALTRIMGQV